MKREKETRREWVGWKRLISSEETKKKKKNNRRRFVTGFCTKFLFHRDGIDIFIGGRSVRDGCMTGIKSRGRGKKRRGEERERKNYSCNCSFQQVNESVSE